MINLTGTACILHIYNENSKIKLFLKARINNGNSQTLYGYIYDPLLEQRAKKLKQGDVLSINGIFMGFSTPKEGNSVTINIKLTDWDYASVNTNSKKEANSTQDEVIQEQQVSKKFAEEIKEESSKSQGNSDLIASLTSEQKEELIKILMQKS